MLNLSGGGVMSGREWTDDGEEHEVRSLKRRTATAGASTGTRPHSDGTRLRPGQRPYDLRHAGSSFWLYSGVDPADCARSAGQSIEVLFRH
ncbi:site-specific integrase [Streptomyces olivochromogenes]|uniref:Site-specific integrase n=1 Tax=Streptomyces olivochromogenes TaxID=1963 RepID=A0A250VDF3_STROL|nr:site-specific integrase [Streptomyces olivochromogenes]